MCSLMKESIKRRCKSAREYTDVQGHGPWLDQGSWCSMLARADYSNPVSGKEPGVGSNPEGKITENRCKC